MIRRCDILLVNKAKKRRFKMIVQNKIQIQYFVHANTMFSFPLKYRFHFPDTQKQENAQSAGYSPTKRLPAVRTSLPDKNAIAIVGETSASASKDRPSEKGRERGREREYKSS